MALDFIPKDVIHRIAAKFVHAYLPDAKKPYNLRAVHQPDLDIHGVASKAEVYNITTPPKVIEEGLTAGLELIYYLAADGAGLKIESDEAHWNDAGLFFEDPNGAAVKAEALAVNEPRTLKAVVPASLAAGTA
jgi:hypothetical protein